MSLYEKLMEVRRSVDYLQKAQKNEKQKFNYVSSAQVLGAVRDAMNEQGLLLEPRVIKAIFHHKGSESMHFTELKMTMTWVDTETGEKSTHLWYAQGTDQHEKGVGKALTYAEKFFILKYFNIPTDKWDPDAWEASQEKKERKRKEKQPQKPSKPAQKPEKEKTSTDGGAEKDESTQMPTMAGKNFKNHGQRIKAFIEVCGQFKKIVGEDAYYEILKANGGYDKANKVRKRDHMNAIYTAFKRAAAEILGGEVVR